MKKIKCITIVVNLLLLLGYFNWSVLGKEKTLNEGQLVLLELAPVDPRSLMQGDYMRLNYAIADTLDGKSNQAKRGYCVVRVAADGVAEFIRYQDNLQPINTGEKAIKYFYRGSRFLPVSLGAESYFFEEGTSNIYEHAKFGGLKVDADGNSILTGLYDEKRQLIKGK